MITYKVATTEAERNEAINLVRDVYIAEGYMSATTTTDEHEHFLHAPESTTILCQDTQLLGTISLIEDMGKSLPMGQIFSAELQELRQTRQNIAEVCQFAILKKEGRTNLDISLGLLSHVIHTALSKNIHSLCFTINPKHQLFYRGLGCQQIGTTKPYPFVNNAPALAFFLDLIALQSPAQFNQHNSILKKILTQKPHRSFLMNV